MAFTECRKRPSGVAPMPDVVTGFEPQYAVPDMVTRPADASQLFASVPGIAPTVVLAPGVAAILGNNSAHRQGPLPLVPHQPWLGTNLTPQQLFAGPDMPSRPSSSYSSAMRFDERAAGWRTQNAFMDCPSPGSAYNSITLGAREPVMEADDSFTSSLDLFEVCNCSAHSWL